ncbi:MAG: hypothetical protein AAF363_18755 [Bacteroidota bacterium]
MAHKTIVLTNYSEIQITCSAGDTLEVSYESKKELNIIGNKSIFRIIKSGSFQFNYENLIFEDVPGENGYSVPILDNSDVIIPVLLPKGKIFGKCVTDGTLYLIP